MKKITIEEHYTTEEAQLHLRSPEQSVADSTVDRMLIERVEERLRDMDEAGIDMQVLSFSAVVIDRLEASAGLEMAKRTNEKVAKVINQHPDRLAAFATLALQQPEEAAKELERAVKQLGLKGTMVNPHINGEYLDNKKFWVVMEKAEELGVPVYVHPGPLSPDMIKPYLVYPALARAMWGFAAVTGLGAMRLIISGIFDRYPHLKIILGHMGESIPFWLWRLDDIWQNEKLKEGAQPLKKNPSQYFKENFYVTTSGMLWVPTLQFVSSVIGTDRVLLAADYPHGSNMEATRFIDLAPISDSEKEKICHLNAERILKL